MRELIKSIISFSWAASLFCWTRVGQMLFSRADATSVANAAPLNRIAQAASEEFTAPLKAVFQAGGSVQDRIFDSLSAGSSATQPEPTRTPDPGRLNCSCIVALGESLAAGMGNFTLNADSQRASFLALMAKQMGVSFPQRLIQPPGIGCLPGFARLPVRIPGTMQTTVVEEFPGPGRPGDLSIPGLHVSDALNLRPTPPIVHRDDALQTAVNLILGLNDLISGMAVSYRTQLDCAVQMAPTFAVICLGYQEALEAAVAGNASLLPDLEFARTAFSQILSALRGGGAQVLLLTVPDPLDTAHFASLDVAAKTVKVERSLLQSTYGLGDDDRIKLPGLFEIGNQFLKQAPQRLHDDAVLTGHAARAISAKIGEWNREMVRIGAEKDAIVYDLHSLFQMIKNKGISLSGRTITGHYLGGFYSLNGYYPGETGNALICNDMLRCLNHAFGANFPLVDSTAVMKNDAVAMYQAAPGPDWTASNVLQPWILQMDPARKKKSIVREVGSKAPEQTILTQPGSGRLQLPEALEQTLPLCVATSYFGEAIRAVDCRNPGESKYGTYPEMLFSGLVMVDSHLKGDLNIRFAPVVNDISHFEIRLGSGLTGEDNTLTAPQLYRLPFHQNRLDDPPGVISSGDLNLATGEVTNLNFACKISTSGLFALAVVNPSFPKGPIVFPGEYGSVWARFEPRPDGKLDFTFFGTTFLPLGGELGGYMVRFPLPFAGPNLEFGSIPARGTVMHPHVSLSTKDIPIEIEACPDLPENTIAEYTLFTHNSSFGDHFSLNVEEFGGSGTGRSQLMGRIEIQFGVRSGNSLPIAITCLSPGGLMIPLAESPISQAFPGRLAMGPLGFDEFLRFPLRTYLLEGVSFLDDPFDISIGSVDLRSGKLLAELLHRGFIDQDVILALLRIEPRTPKSSFFFRGPAAFERGPNGQLVFRLMAHILVPYPSGFKFPQPDLATAFTVGDNSVLDPFLWLQAMGPSGAMNARITGEGQDITASVGDLFSYKFVISGQDGDAPQFEYTNHSQGGFFRMHTLTWSSFLRSITGHCENGEYDTVAFSGFGFWNKDGVRSLQQASVQISNSRQQPYIGIQIGGGAVSNVDTKPQDMSEVRP